MIIMQQIRSILITLVTILAQLFFTLTNLSSPIYADSIKIKEPQNIGIPSSSNPGTILGNIITIIFTVGAVAALFYLLWGTVEWILSGGDKEKIASARKRITHALIGLALLALAFFIAKFAGETVNLDPTAALRLPKLNE